MTGIHFVCDECRNSVPAAAVVRETVGSQGPVFVWPESVRCGACAYVMRQVVK